MQRKGISSHVLPVFAMDFRYGMAVPVYPNVLYNKCFTIGVIHGERQPRLEPLYMHACIKDLCLHWWPAFQLLETF